MKASSFIIILTSAFLQVSCVSNKKFTRLQTRYTQLEGDLSSCNNAKAELARQKASVESDKAGLETRISDLNKQIEFLKENNTTVLKQLQDLSVLSSSQAESIKRSLENIGAKDIYIQNLQAAMSRKDSLNLVLIMNLKGAIGDLNDKDINIKIDKGVVYIDISDKLLFKTGRYEVTTRAQEVLGKVATVLKNQPEIEFMVEGHTDTVPYRSGVLLDNWDLSVKRATSVVRILQNQYGMDPAKMSAAGRGEYNPLLDNSTAENRAINRRTRIIILPQLDQFFKLLEPR